jgi:hypothetical protein
MTAERQEKNGWRPGIAFITAFARRARASLVWTGLVCLSAVWTGFGAPASLPSAAQAATTERVIVNRFSGLAIEGFDPVAYFTDSRPEIGVVDFEASEAGAVWRFRNEGNRASFVAHPEIYGPQFGGYDPTDIARGVPVAGNPMFWLISGQRLYLFGREETRNAFAADPQRLLREAKQRWPGLEQTLAQ